MLKYIILTLIFINNVVPKYMEGQLRTSEDWAFLARFCFLSQQGTFEYYFQFRAEQGFPNLLLYYDADSQWPSVYKTSKTCYEKEAVLNIEQNQIVNLTVQYPHKEFSGCTYTQLDDEDFTEYTTKKSTVHPTRARTYTVNVEGKTRTTKSMTKIKTTPPTPTEEFYKDTMDTNYTNTNQSEIFNIEEVYGEDIENVTETHLDEEKIIRKRSITTKSPDDIKNVIITCRNARRFRSVRARWWFIAISNCNGHKGIDVSYQLLMTNGPPGDYWHEHFSADEFYILPILMAFSTGYGMLLFAIVMCSVELKSRQLLHSTYKLFVISVLAEFIGICLQSIVYLKYAVVGIMATKVKTIGGIFMGTSETIFLLVLLLLAKGYTTTRGRLPLSASIKLTIFMNLYAITYITLFIYETKVFDPGQVLYLYESPAGYGVIVLRIIAWWMFIYSTIFTLKHYPEKSNFYYPFNICGTLWFVAGPAFILSANSYIDKWVRESVVYGVLLFITFSGHLMFLLLTLPAMANKNFPYHIRTTQIGVMEVNGISGESTIDQFSHHPYQPTSRIEQTVIIPLNPMDWGTPVRKVDETQKADNEDDRNLSDREMNGNTIKDDVMENVLNWSRAKGLPSPHSASTKAESPTPITLSPNSVFRQQNISETYNTTEWVREVPVELFTISRLVGEKKNNE